MHSVLRSFVTLSLVVTLLACSDDSSKSFRATQLQGWVGAQGLDSAQVIVNQISESGQVAVDANGIYLGNRESTDSDSKFVATFKEGESTLIIARGQVANVDRDKKNPATRILCQVKAGCAHNGSNYGFAAYYPATSGFEWRSIVFNPTDGSRNNVNALTTMAAAFAYAYDVNSNSVNNIQFNDVFTAYDIVLANSLLSNLFGMNDLVGDLPANLTRLNNLDANYAGAQNQIRYGALLSALQQLELEYNATNLAVTDPDFITKVAAEYVQDEGQLFYRTETTVREVTLEKLYRIAHDNLLAIAPTVSNSGIRQLVNAEVTRLSENLEFARTQTADTKTSAAADELDQLLSESELSSINIGLEKTKLFVNSINDFHANFWTDGYKAQIDAYRAMLKGMSDTHKDTLDALVQDFSLVQEYYVTCKVGGRDCAEAKFADLEARSSRYDSNSKVLTFDDGNLTVSQKLANLAVNSSAAVSASNAVDILIVGTLTRGDLVLKLDHSYNDTAKTSIKTASSMRIYYSQKVSEVPQQDMTIEGYEIIWSNFQLYDQTAVGTDTETDLSGSFKIFYRGLRDPQVPEPNNSELRFNVEGWTLSSKIGDKVSDSIKDGEVTSLIISAKASNADTYYPSADTPKKFANLDGFFTTNDDVKVTEIDDLLTYRLGTEVLVFGAKSVEVQTIDFLNAKGKNTRYRFYPNSLIEDKRDANGNGNTDEVLTMHLIEECQLDEVTDSVIKCGAKSRVFEARNLQKTINDLWKLGAFQKTDVDGRGSYAIDFPTTEVNGCLNLDTLAGTQSLKGTLIDQQVLGLDSLRFTSEVSLQDDEQVTLPRTLFDMKIVAPKEDKYKINMALSHNFTSTIADSTANAQVLLGSGTKTNVLRFGYDTSADFANSGTYSVLRSGIELTLADGREVVENQDLTAFLSQTYSDDVDYKIVENEKGLAERCILPVTEAFKKDTLDDQVYYLNYRSIVYGTVRLDTGAGDWKVTYIDGTTEVINFTLPDVPLINTSGPVPVLDFGSL